MVEAQDGLLTPVQQRVVGALAEKEATVPDTYPMTLRELLSACNQSNSRDPVTDHDERTVLAVLDELKARNLVRFVHPSHGARSTKYRHVLHERLHLEPAELALLTVLLLRGPQTVTELRTRTERAHAFAGTDEVVATLEGLADRPEPLVVHLPRQSGHKETRWMHLLGGEPDLTAAPAEPAAPEPTVEPGLAARVGALEDRVAALEAILGELGLTDPPPDREQPSP